MTIRRIMSAQLPPDYLAAKEQLQERGEEQT